MLDLKNSVQRSIFVGTGLRHDRKEEKILTTEDVENSGQSHF
jgi:hypothetical protein